MKASRIFVLMLALAAAAIIGGRTLMKAPQQAPAPQVATHPAAPPTAPDTEQPQTVATPEAPQTVLNWPTAPEPKPAPVAVTQAGLTPKPATPAPNPPRSKKPPIQDPIARDALYWVGADPEAEAYWYQAINDPYLPPTERQDLIEDLNEDGFTNPKKPTVEDLPLIVSRILLIENIAYDAMDQVNAEAFAEAYKDLVNLYDRLTR